MEYDDPDVNPGAPLEVYEDHSRSILASNDSPDVGFKWSVNPYRGCFHACAYCLAGDTPILMGDEVRFYYGGYRGTAIGAVGLDRQIIGSGDDFSGIGLATMPRDRFVAIAPDPEIGLRNSQKVARDAVGKPAPKAIKPNRIGQVTLRALALDGVRSITINANARVVTRA